jgi:predicted DNA-binding antitoxin AbrB/MazE fold protein
MTIKAKYEKGVFRPLEDVKLEDGTLVDVYAPTPEAKIRSIKDYAFVGMWKDRKDIRDGVEYEDRLRDHPRS